MGKQIKPCPKCGESVGWWEKIYESYRQFYTPEGEGDFAADNEKSFGRGGKVKYCYDCNKIITDCISDED